MKNLIYISIILISLSSCVSTNVQKCKSYIVTEVSETDVVNRYGENMYRVKMKCDIDVMTPNRSKVGDTLIYPNF